MSVLVIRDSDGKVLETLGCSLHPSEVAAAEQRGAERGRQEERAAVIKWLDTVRNKPQWPTIGAIQEGLWSGDHHAHGHTTEGI